MCQPIMFAHLCDFVAEVNFFQHLLGTTFWSAVAWRAVAVVLRATLALNSKVVTECSAQLNICTVGITVSSMELLQQVSLHSDNTM